MFGKKPVDPDKCKRCKGRGYNTPFHFICAECGGTGKAEIFD